jgi:hypothetical protein
VAQTPRQARLLPSDSVHQLHHEPADAAHPVDGREQ